MLVVRFLPDLLPTTTLSSAIVHSDGVHSEYCKAEAADPTGLPLFRRGGRCVTGAIPSSDLVCLTGITRGFENPRGDLTLRRPGDDCNCFPLPGVECPPRVGEDSETPPRAGETIFFLRELDGEEEPERDVVRAVKVTPQQDIKKNFMLSMSYSYVRRKSRNSGWNIEP